MMNHPGLIRELPQLKIGYQRLGVKSLNQESIRDAK